MGSKRGSYCARSERARLFACLRGAFFLVVKCVASISRQIHTICSDADKTSDIFESFVLCIHITCIWIHITCVCYLINFPACATHYVLVAARLQPALLFVIAFGHSAHPICTCSRFVYLCFSCVYSDALYICSAYVYPMLWKKPRNLTRGIFCRRTVSQCPVDLQRQSFFVSSKFRNSERAALHLQHSFTGSGVLIVVVPLAQFSLLLTV